MFKVIIDTDPVLRTLTVRHDSADVPASDPIVLNMDELHHVEVSFGDTVLLSEADASN